MCVNRIFGKHRNKYDQEKHDVDQLILQLIKQGGYQHNQKQNQQENAT